MAATIPINTIPSTSTNLSLDLPDDALYVIFSQVLRAKEITSLLSTNRRFYQFISTTNILWEGLVVSEFPHSIPSPLNPAEYKKLYKHLKMIDNKIRSAGRFRTRTFPPHEGAPINSLNPQGAFLFSSGPNVISVFDLNTEKHFHWLGKNPGSRTVLHEGELFVGNRGGTIKVWDPKTGKELRTWNDNQGDILNVAIHKGKLLSSGNASVKAWDPKTGNELTNWSPIPGAAKEQVIQGDTIFITDNLTIKVCDLDTGSVLFTLSDNERVDCLAVHKNHLFSSTDKTIKIWDLNTKKKRDVVMSCPDTVASMSINEGRLYSRYGARYIRIWDLDTGKELQTITASEDGISLAVKDGKIYFGTRKGRIKVFDFQSPYDKQMLEETLSLLGQLAKAEHEKSIQETTALTKKLHPDFQDRLEHHVLKCGSHALSKEPILRMQMEVCIELLLDCIHRDDQGRISELLHQLVWIDSRNTKLYEILWTLSGKPRGENWGEHAFHSRRASFAHQVLAVLEFKEFLKEPLDVTRL